MIHNLKIVPTSTGQQAEENTEKVEEANSSTVEPPIHVPPFDGSMHEGESVMKLDNVKRNRMERRTASRGTCLGVCKRCGGGKTSSPYTSTHRDNTDTVVRVERRTNDRPESA